MSAPAVPSGPGGGGGGDNGQRAPPREGPARPSPLSPSDDWAWWVGMGLLGTILALSLVSGVQQWLGAAVRPPRTAPPRVAAAPIAVALHARALQPCARTVCVLLAAAAQPERVTVHVAEAHGVRGGSVTAAARALASTTPAWEHLLPALEQRLHCLEVVAPGAPGAPGEAVLPGLHALLQHSVRPGEARGDAPGAPSPPGPAFVLLLGGPVAVAPRWDERLLVDWAAAGDATAVLTTAPPPAAHAGQVGVHVAALTRLATVAPLLPREGGEGRPPASALALAPTGATAAPPSPPPTPGLPLFVPVALADPRGAPLPPGTVLPRPLPSVGWSPGLCFAPAEALASVPLPAALPLPDAYAATLQAARLWTAGWTLYAPGEALFAAHELPPVPLTRPQAAGVLGTLPLLRAALGLAPSPVRPLPVPSSTAAPVRRRLQGAVGLGTARAVQQFWVWAGYDVVTGRVTPAGARGRPAAVSRAARAVLARKPTPADAPPQSSAAAHTHTAAPAGATAAGTDTAQTDATPPLSAAKAQALAALAADTPALQLTAAAERASGQQRPASPLLLHVRT